jgi:murein DD-endopeptidase MepM/ murein hydrolase activator NlpD
MFLEDYMKSLLFVLFITVSAFIIADDMESANADLSEMHVVYPVKGELAYDFGWENSPTGDQIFNKGIGLAADVGTPVMAVMDGEITLAGTHSRYGKFIIITHTDGYQTIYAYLDSFSVNNGDYVKQGDKIGEVGNSSRGSHLHFAIFRDGRFVNPNHVLASVSGTINN